MIVLSYQKYNASIWTLNYNPTQQNFLGQPLHFIYPLPTTIYHSLIVPPLHTVSYSLLFFLTEETLLAMYLTWVPKDANVSYGEHLEY